MTVLGKGTFSVDSLNTRNTCISIVIGEGHPWYSGNLWTGGKQIEGAILHQRHDSLQNSSH